MLVRIGVIVTHIVHRTIAPTDALASSLVATSVSGLVPTNALATTATGDAGISHSAGLEKDAADTSLSHDLRFWLRPALVAVRRDLAEVRFGLLVVALLGAVFVVAARAVVLFGFVFLDDFFVVETFFVEAFFFGAADAGFAFRRGDFVVRFLAAPIAAPESAPITVPTTGTPRAVPATAPATAPPSVLPAVVFSALAASSSFFFSSMFSP